MKNNKWSTRSIDDRDMNVVLFVSRNKDNQHIENFKERRMSFTTKEDCNSIKLNRDFDDFVSHGVSSEVCRMYFSVNTRDEDKVYKQLLHFLIDTPDFNLCSISQKIAGIAAQKECAKTKRWMFDFDLDDSTKADEFINDIKSIDSAITITKHKTPHGYAIITDRGFDTRELYTKWNENDVTLKRDDLLCVKWTTKQ